MLSIWKWCYLVVVLVLCAPFIQAESPEVFSVPDSTLLFGFYEELRIVTPDHVVATKPPSNIVANGGVLVFPSISLKGDLIAWGFAVEGVPAEDAGVRETRFVLGIFSLKTRKWKTYGAYGGIANPVFSSDGSKVAFFGGDKNDSNFFILDLTTETITKLPNLNQQEVRALSVRSWSPDGKRFAVEMRKDGKSLVGVLDMTTSKVQILAEGSQPTWSPNGEWIAYYDTAKQSCVLAHPDGTPVKVIRKAGRSRFGFQRWFGWGGPVWSPDSKHLLLSEIKGEQAGVVDVLVDVDDGLTQTKLQDGLPVFGWAGSR
jgi:Tol biopolymer transport system component